MRIQILRWRSVFGLLGLVLLLSSTGAALAGSSASTNTLTFSESYSEKVVCVNAPSLSCGILAKDSFTISATVLLTGVNIATFGPTTSFDLTLGTLQISHPLSNDPKYTTGKTSATFTASYVDGKGKTVVYRTVKLKWTAAQLTVSVKGKIKDTSTSGWTSILANTFAGQPSVSGTFETSGSISFGATSVTFDPLAGTGSVVTKNVMAKDGSPFAPSTVKIKGSGVGSVVHITIPPAQVTLGTDTVVTNVAVGNQGGTVTFSSGLLNGVTVAFPPGALATNLHVAISRNSTTVVPNSGTFSGQTIDLQTDGSRQFDEPVEITIPFTYDGTSIPVPYYIDTNGHLLACQVTGIDRQAGKLTFETWHASLFTWILAHLGGAVEAHTTYFAGTDGFQVGNATYSTPYNIDGNCFGMCAFEQWYFIRKGGGLYPKYMQNLPVPGYAPIKGQDCIATRAMNSVSRVYEHYWERKAAQFSLTAEERFAFIKNIIANTAAPTILSGRSGPNGHAFLATDSFQNGTTNTLWINDPNIPGHHVEMAYIEGSTNLSYNTSYGDVFTNITAMGNGSWQFEPFDLIYADAEAGFSGNGAAQVNVTSHTDGAVVTNRNITFSGTIASGQVKVSKLSVTVNGSATVDTLVNAVTGDFSMTLSLNVGTNDLTFLTRGYNSDDELVQLLNTQKQPFKIIVNLDAAAILITLTWNTDIVDLIDLDLYTGDPTGDWSWGSYGQRITADGGELDYDSGDGDYGSEHWTLTYGDTVRWGSTYTVRVHYWSDYLSCTAPYCTPVVPTRPTGWTVTVLVYENTPRMTTYSFSGVLSVANPSNVSPGSSGPDWANVCTITPVEGPGPTVVRKTSEGEIEIIVPILQDELDLDTTKP